MAAYRSGELGAVDAEQSFPSLERKFENKILLSARRELNEVERMHRAQRSHEAIDRVPARHAQAPMRSDAEIRSARQKGRP